MEGRELENGEHVPIGEETEEVAEIFGGIDAVMAAAGDQGDEGGIDVAAFVGAEEEPVLAADCFATELAFAEVVVDWNAPVGEKLPQGSFLIARIRDGLRDRGLVEDAC